mmetsp:Transcript_7811/g.11419  ORF Transcript_7811/g.11419 Transcript_7811/m.11419 type:complete len:82 (+) Transcript_7811:47-292(+)
MHVAVVICGVFNISKGRTEGLHGNEYALPNGRRMSCYASQRNADKSHWLLLPMISEKMIVEEERVEFCTFVKFGCYTFVQR